MKSTTSEQVQTPVASKQLYLLSALTQDPKKALEVLNSTITEAGANVEKTEDLGSKRLAFAINKRRELNLVSVFFTTDAETVRNLEKELKHTEEVERFIVTAWRASLEETRKRSRN